jgi:hypothetical protein
MENPSIYAVFERMWQYVLSKLNSYVTNEIYDIHLEDGSNPHGVTAEQAGALPITGGVMEDAVTFNGIVLTEGTDYGDGDPGSGVLGQLYFKRVT